MKSEKKTVLMEIRFFSTLLSASVISINTIAGTIPKNKEIEKFEAWLVCETSMGSTISCNDNSKYRHISDPNLIKKLKEELASKDASEIDEKKIELARDEISKYYNYVLKGDGNPYKEPKLNFGMLDKVEELNLKAQLRDIAEEIKKNPDVTGDDLYNNPKLKLSTIPKKKFDEVLLQIRRNNYGTTGEKYRGAFVVCGIVGTILVDKASDVIVSKSNPKSTTPPALNEEAQKLKESYYDKIIPIATKSREKPDEC